MPIIAQFRPGRGWFSRQRPVRIRQFDLIQSAAICPHCRYWRRGRCKLIFSGALEQPSIQLNLNIDTCWKLQLHEGIDGLVCRIDDIHEPFVRPDFVLIAGVLVDMR